MSPAFPRGLPVSAVLILVLAGSMRGRADTISTPARDEPRTCLHAQSTLVIQGHGGFPAPYEGPNSLEQSEVKETLSFDLIGGGRIGRGGEVFADLLIWQGFGLSDAVGVEGFPNGEAFRLGTNRPAARLVRLFWRQTLGFGGGSEWMDADAFTMAGRRDARRLTLTLGKISVKDIFDNNAYANDPRTQFLNWALMANEAWDYPADSLGYTTGAAAEWNEPGGALRLGVFRMPRVSNGLSLDPRLTRAWGGVVEGERRYLIAERPGALRLLFFVNRANMGNYRDATARAARPADIEATRSDRKKLGVGLNCEQELAKDFGAFLRAGWSDGRDEAWAFSDVDRSLSTGFSLRGGRWGRAADTIGVAFVANGISAAHRDFLAAGGTGILAGDSMLRYGWEKIAEVYYDWKPTAWLAIAFDYQWVQNPAFNRDRGPVSVLGLRVHVER